MPPFSLLADLAPPPFFFLEDLPGFLGTRASFMLDVVFLAMFAVIPLMGLSIGLARYRRLYGAHKTLQLTLGTVLLVAVLAFEIDMRFFTDWEELAAPSPYYAAETWCPVWIALAVHLAFAVPTTLLWVVVIYRALRGFARPPRPGPHSGSHMLWGRVAGFGMLMTGVTGWVFYYLAFAAS